MALKSSVCGSTGLVSQLGRGDQGHSPVRSNRYLVGLSHGERPGRILGLYALRATRSAEGESPSKSSTELRPVRDRAEGNVPPRLQKDLSSLPSGSKIRCLIIFT